MQFVCALQVRDGDTVSLPLRKIVAEENDQYGRVVEVLECGHKQTQKEDIYGPTNAYKRRCRKCASAVRHQQETEP
jgi:hypothetical protein